MILDVVVFRQCKDIYNCIYDHKIDNGIQSFKNIFYPVSLSLKSLALPILLLKNGSVSKEKSKEYADIRTACIQNGHTIFRATAHGRVA